MIPNLARIYRVFKREGLRGVSYRLASKISVAKIWMAYALNQKTVKSNYGILLSSNFGDNTFSLYVTGAYGTFYWDHLIGKTENFVFIDIGANQGLYTIAAALNPYNLQAYAFEPVSDTFQKLSENVDLNNVDHKCQLIKAGISSECESVEIYRKIGHSGAASLAMSNDLSKDTDITETIETIDGSALGEIVKHDDAPIFVKIDVEGYELIVLKQLAKTPFLSSIKEIFYEVDEKWVDPNEIQDLLSEMGFTSFHRVGRGAHRTGPGAHYEILATR